MCFRSQEPKKIQGLDGRRNLQIRFRTRMPPHLFTGGKVEGEQGSAIRVVLIDANTGNVVQTGEESMAKLNVVVLDGDFNDEDDEDWTREHFESFLVKEREGKRPILTGHTHVVLKEGVGTLGELTFNDNSSWIRSRKFRLGVKAASGFRIREAKTEPFAVKDHRGEREFLKYFGLKWREAIVYLNLGSFFLQYTRNIIHQLYMMKSGDWIE